MRSSTSAGLGLAAAFLVGAPALGAVTNNILITGYWPPTNNMLRKFSTSGASNPGGWRGGNWEGRGYNVHAYFPEFPGQTGPSWGQGSGDLEVDYQDTAADWARIVAEVKPVAIVTFSRSNTTNGWELEPAYQRFRLPGESSPPGRTVPLYTQDYSGTRYPTDVPIAQEPVGTIRNSTLPMPQIVADVAGQMPSSLVSPFVQAYNPASPGSYDFAGGFLSGYIAYLGAWYHDLNSGPDAAFQNLAAGHIHVGQGMDLAAAMQATEITLRTLTAYLDTVVPAPGTGAAFAAGAIWATRRRRARG